MMILSVALASLIESCISEALRVAIYRITISAKVDESYLDAAFVRVDVVLSDEITTSASFVCGL